MDADLPPWSTDALRGFMGPAVCQMAAPVGRAIVGRSPAGAHLETKSGAGYMTRDVAGLLRPLVKLRAVASPAPIQSNSPLRRVWRESGPLWPGRLTVRMADFRSADASSNLVRALGWHPTLTNHSIVSNRWLNGANARTRRTAPSVLACGAPCWVGGGLRADTWSNSSRLAERASNPPTQFRSAAAIQRRVGIVNPWDGVGPGGYAALYSARMPSKP